MATSRCTIAGGKERDVLWMVLNDGSHVKLDIESRFDSYSGVGLCRWTSWLTRQKAFETLEESCMIHQ